VLAAAGFTGEAGLAEPAAAMAARRRVPDDVGSLLISRSTDGSLREAGVPEKEPDLTRPPAGVTNTPSDPESLLLVVVLFRTRTFRFLSDPVAGAAVVDSSKVDDAAGEPASWCSADSDMEKLARDGDMVTAVATNCRTPETLQGLSPFP